MLRTVTIALAALFLATSALASEGKLGTSKGGEHAAGPTGSTGPSPASTGVTGGSDSSDRQLGTGSPLSLSQRFRFELGWEMHGMLVQNNLVGNGAETVFHYVYAGVTYYLTPKDKLSFSAGFYRFALYDPSEPNGFRADDLLLRYSHHFMLPWSLGLDLSGSVTGPVSFASQKMGLVTEPQIRAGLGRTFAKYVSLNATVYGAYYWQTYTTMQGGSSPNPAFRGGGRFNVEAELPWHTALALGVDVATAYTTFYNPAGQPLNTPGVPSSSGTGPSYGTEKNPVYQSQPVQQDYGFDIYIRYDLPKVLGVKTTATVSYAQGDPTAGYTSSLIDGVSNLFLFYPEASQVYLSLALTY